MPTLLDLTSQGDVATISDESKLASVKLMEPQQLYDLWERQNWQSATVDLEQDRRDWEALPEDERPTSPGTSRRSSWERSGSPPSSRGW
jgi:ribonucleoside-diphosphate reductase beta chain